MDTEKSLNNYKVHIIEIAKALVKLTCPIPRPSLVLLIITGVILLMGIILYPVVTEPFEDTTASERSVRNLSFHVTNTTLLISIATFLFTKEFLKMSTQPKNDITKQPQPEPPK